MPAWLTARPIAHRGLHDAANGVVENTLAAAEAAIRAGFAIECDVQLSADGEAFVFHDETLDRLTDASGALIEKTAGEIRRARILRREAAGAPAPLVGAGGGGGSDGRSSSSEFRRADFRPDRNSRVGPTERHGATPNPNPPPQGGRNLPRRSRPSPNCSHSSLAARPSSASSRAVSMATGGSASGPWRWPRTTRVRSRSRASIPTSWPTLRLRYPRLTRPVGVVAEASYDDAYWDFLDPEQKRACESFDHSRPERARFPVVERRRPAAQDTRSSRRSCTASRS